MNLNRIDYCINNWLLDLPAGVIIHQMTGEKKRLGEYQIKLLEVLVQHAGKTLSREELTTLVWERRVIGNNSLPNAIHALRVALEDDGKQQRIIKTIPKKGYILEEEYCETVLRPVSPDEILEEDETVNSDDAEDELSESESWTEEKLSTNADSEFANYSNGTTPSQVTTITPKKTLNEIFQRSPIVLSCVLILALSGWIASFFMSKNEPPKLQAQEQHENVYSNIRLYDVQYAGNIGTIQEKLYERLKDTFYMINQNLLANNAQMNVYYHTSSSMLNMTLLLKNACQEQQLSMTIYHWRQSSEQLNNLIYRETERKLNEMDTCTG